MPNGDNLSSRVHYFYPPKRLTVLLHFFTPFFSDAGYNIVEDSDQTSAVIVTREKKIDLQRKQTSRTVFLCQVKYNFVKVVSCCPGGRLKFLILLTSPICTITVAHLSIPMFSTLQPRSRFVGDTFWHLWSIYLQRSVAHSAYLFLH